MATSTFLAVALDLGTTAIKAGLLDESGNLGGIVSRPAPEVAVNGGRYESDALAYAQVAEQVLGECRVLAGVLPLGLCSQRSSFLIWDRATGQPVSPLISWQDNRGAASCEALRQEEGVIRELTGLRLAPYYFAPKLRVVFAERPELRAGLERGELLAGMLDTFLIWRWSGGRHFVTDASMAARTLLMAMRSQRWSPTLCDLFGIPLSVLPEIKPSLGLNLPLDNGLTLKASMGDQSAALMASVGGNSRDVLVNLGTGGFAMRYLEEGEAALAGYLLTLVYQDSRSHGHVAMEGTLNSLATALAPYPVGECGSADFARDEIFCLAEPSGLGAPYFRNDLGMRFSAPVGHLSQHRVGCLLLEGIVFRVARMLEDFHRAAPIGRVLLSGGLSELVALQQGIVQCAPCEVLRLEQKDSSLHGAALAAAGMESAQRSGAVKIQLERNDHALEEKYRRWKDWFDALLAE
jgi:glycerol kinase